MARPLGRHRRSGALRQTLVGVRLAIRPTDRLVLLCARTRCGGKEIATNDSAGAVLNGMKAPSQTMGRKGKGRKDGGEKNIPNSN